MELFTSDPGGTPSTGMPGFGDPDLLRRLESSALDEFDRLGFGLITMDRRAIVTGYNTFESTRAGIRPERVLGRNFFVDVAPCVNNYLVAERYGEDALDEELDYVFTFRMRPTPVRLRMLAAAGSPRQYMAVRSR